MQEWKASEKEAQKMTRDGAISVNLVTGEATHVSDRPPEQDYSSADETAGVLSRAVDEAAGHVERRQAKKARRKRRDTFRDGEAARDRPSSRLQFSEADRAAPELKKAVRKSDKAADKLDAAKAAVPVKPPGKEHGNPLSRPVQEVKSTPPRRGEARWRVKTPASRPATWGSGRSRRLWAMAAAASTRRGQTAS